MSKKSLLEHYNARQNFEFRLKQVSSFHSEYWADASIRAAHGRFDYHRHHHQPHCHRQLELFHLNYLQLLLVSSI